MHGGTQLVAETLEAFLSRHIRQVNEEGHTVKCFRLEVCETGKVFDSWFSPFRAEEQGPGPAKLAEEIEDVCKGFADSFPARSGQAIEMQIVAENTQGKDVGYYIRKVFGTNKSGKSSSILGGDTSIAEGARLHVETTRQLQAALVTHINLQTQQIKMLVEQTQAQHLMIINQSMRQLEEVEVKKSEIQSSGADLSILVDKVLEKVGPVAQLVMDAMADGKKSSLASAALALNNAAKDAGKPS
jgi:hypothetical protein